MTQSYIDQLDAAIEINKQARDVGKAIERLYANADFKRVILEGYLEQEAIRLVHLRADVNAQKPEVQAAILREIDGIAYLDSFLRTSMTLARRADDEITSNEEARAEALAEDLE